MSDRVRILVVDHDPIHRADIRRAIEQSTLDAVVVEATTPDEAFAALQTGAACVLVDQDLPQKGALVIVTSLRGDRNPVPILLLTGLQDEEHLQQAFEFGVTDFFPKMDVSPRRLSFRIKFAMRLAASEVDNIRSIATATAAARARDEILAIVSHDLRGPLHAISLASEALREDAATEDAKRYLSAIDRAGSRAERLISDLLDASAIENGKLSLNKARINLNSVVKQAVAEHELIARDSKATITAHLPEAPVYAEADRDRLLQALANLIGNAIKHARGTPIDLSIAERDHHAILIVSDRGPGIPAGEIQHVFDRYWSGRARKGGAGLGLAIAKGIALAHGGTIQVFSLPDEGARFELALRT